MKVDHLIIFSNQKGTEAAELIEFGLVEGSNRIHPGQGTRNRKFYFENFFLEITWVTDMKEITSEITAPTQLWERSNHNTSDFSPFGLCLAKTDDTSELFQDSIKYRPSYLPEGHAFEIITNADYPYLLWTCRLPFTRHEYTTDEPKNHPIGVRNLTKVIFHIPQKYFQNNFIQFIEDKSIVVFEETNTSHHLILVFDEQAKSKMQRFSNLPLSIAY